MPVGYWVHERLLPLWFVRNFEERLRREQAMQVCYLLCTFHEQSLTLWSAWFSNHSRLESVELLGFLNTSSLPVCRSCAKANPTLLLD